MAHYLEQRLKIRHLRVIDALEQHKSLLRASRALRVSQPALSRTLQEVEEIIGAEIFERHPRGVRPNATGKVLTATARKLLSTIRDLETELDRLSDGQQRTIRVGALPVAAHGLLPAVLANAGSRTANLSISVVEGRTDQMIPSLLSGEIDVIVGRLYPPGQSDGLERRVLYNEPISLVARSDHPLFAMPAISVAEVQRFSLVLPAVSTLMERDVREILRQIGLSTDAAVQSTSVGFMRELLLSGNFVSAVPRVLVAGDLARDMLRILPVPIPAAARPAGIIHRGNLGDAGKLLLAELEREVARLEESDIVELPLRD
ncbi:MAG: transcriptional regulator [Novosphingobium pentaromativorans]|uniref:Transcriptional regulator n=1 Tax=Novosphingobium pentaromativorans TaxID=205844 RepID=A0A2W5NSZ1_9SPHN|nr:LysR substrate-binding domain-containing protein [Novosphingobium panipatense]PZQ56681.1 MAG: transcriptional regulator [Novosphingobium pentaromativorans]